MAAMINSLKRLAPSKWPKFGLMKIFLQKTRILSMKQTNKTSLAMLFGDRSLKNDIANTSHKRMKTLDGDDEDVSQLIIASWTLYNRVIRMRKTRSLERENETRRIRRREVTKTGLYQIVMIMKTKTKLRRILLVF